jgi:hypothetical protein
METTTREYRISRNIFAYNDHGLGGRQYWDDDKVTWRFITQSDGRVTLELYNQPTDVGPPPYATELEPANLLSSWDMGPLSSLDDVLSAQIDAHGNLRLGADDWDNGDESDKSGIRPGYLVHEDTGSAHLTLRMLNYIEYPAVCDALGHPEYQGYIARLAATPAATPVKLGDHAQYAEVLEALNAPSA